MGELVRLQRYLAAAGVAARRKAEDLITAGRVTVNGDVVTILGTKIDPDVDQVHVDGEAVVALDAFYVLLNKPKGCITAVTDDRGRPTVMDYLPNVPVPVKPVGRLDFYSEGVLLLTNDGELAARLLAPASHVPKTYHVKVHGQLSPADLKRLREGIQLDDGTETMPAEVEMLPGESKHTWLAITIHEGKHRQIHRMIEALGYFVDKLQRVAFANLTFHDLRIGDARELTQQELNELRDTVGLDRSKVARGKWHSRREETDIPRRARAKARAEAEEEQAELEARQAANAARRAARAAGEDVEGGDAWDGEGDADRDVDDIHHAGVDFEDRDAVGEDEQQIHHTGIGFEDRDAIGRARERRGGAGVQRGARGEGPRGARGGSESERPRARGAAGGASRGGGPRGGGFGGARGGESERPRGRGYAGDAAGRGGGSRGEGPRRGGARGGESERPRGRGYAGDSTGRGGPRGEGPRGGRGFGGARGGESERPRGRGLSEERGGRGFGGPGRGEGPRSGRGDGPRGGRGFGGPRGGSESERPRGRGAGGARGEGPRGRGFGGDRPGRGEGPRGARGERGTAGSKRGEGGGAKPSRGGQKRGVGAAKPRGRR